MVGNVDTVHFKLETLYPDLSACYPRQNATCGLKASPGYDSFEVFYISMTL